MAGVCRQRAPTPAPYHLPAFVLREPRRHHLLTYAPGKRPDPPAAAAEGPAAADGGPAAGARFAAAQPGVFGPTQRTMLRNLDAFFTDASLQKIGQCIQQRRSTNDSSVSLRTLDWLVTNYSKKYLVECECQGVRRDLHNAYREVLDFYGRPQFDPFRRGARVDVLVPGNLRQSTIGQLNFFRFLLTSGVLDYALANAQLIEADMIKTLAAAREDRGRGDPGVKRRRMELTPSTPLVVKVIRLRPPVGG